MSKSLCNAVSLAIFFICPAYSFAQNLSADPGKERTRIIVTSDGEVDDECSLVRLLLYANEMEIEGIITSSSQYHWHGHKWAGDDWAQPYLDAYEKIHPNREFPVCRTGRHMTIKN